MMIQCKAAPDPKRKNKDRAPAPQGRDDYQDNYRCSCGRQKYWDATSCYICAPGDDRR